MSVTLFNPRPRAYNAAPGAGSGALSQWTYTCPNGQRAVLTHTFLLIDTNAAAANTIFAWVSATISGTTIRVNQLAGSGAAGPVFSRDIHDIDLQGGDTVIGVTFNTSAVNPAIFVQAVIREYQ